MKKNVIVIMLIFSSVLASAQKDSLRIKELADFGLYPYPSEVELEDISVKDKRISVTPISFEDINMNFTNINDLKWVENIAKKHKAVMLGENHYYKYTHHFRNRLFFALNTYDYYPVVVFENQYSLTAYVRHYLAIEDEDEAEKFFQEEVYEMVNEEEGYDFIQHIRRWNKKYPAKKLMIGYSDVEHDYKTTIKKILLPYFQKVDPDYTVNTSELARVDLKDLITDFRSRLLIAKSQNSIGDYPFLTPEYIESVITNLESLYKCHVYDFMYYRQKAIVRNLTDMKFLGKHWVNQKAFVHAGNYHTPSRFKYPDNGNFYTEGSYLNYDFPPTKGLVYSINLVSFAYSLGKTSKIDLRSSLQVGRVYRSTLNKYQTMYKRNLIKPNDYLFDFKLSGYDSLLVKKSYQIGSNGIMVNSIDWEGVFKDIKENKKQYSRVKRDHHDYQKFDAEIHFMKSPITVVRKKKSAKKK